MKALIFFIQSLIYDFSNLLWAFFYVNSGVSHFAKIKVGLVLAEIRGKWNGAVFSRNRGGAYVRTKVTPTNPQTPSQLGIRSTLAGFSEGWRGLTAAQRLAWNGAVENFPTVDVFGDQRIPSGQQLYIGINMNIANGGGAAITDPPAPVGAEATGALALTATDALDVWTLAYVNTPVPAGTAMLVEATAGKSAGISNFTSFFRVIATVAAAAASPFLGSVDYIAKFGSVDAGLAYGARAKYILLATGEVSVPETTSAIAT